MTTKERAEIKQEIDDLEKKISSSAFVDPSDRNAVRRLRSLLLSDGETTKIKLTAGKIKKSHRVTPFSKTRE